MEDSRNIEPSSEAEDELPALQRHSNVLKSTNLMVWAEEDEEQHQSTPPTAPPPQLAARLYRTTTNRRRTSAASSRRNSLSSSHSHHSSRSFRRSACHTNHVDQHLRRASIIESRRARLADKAAHAELVRHRAALAKAAPRSSNTEEKAMAAQQARERYLAKVAAACAEEVNRAKRVAEETKEKWAAEEKRFRQEVEEKHAEAERRRQELKKNSRRPRASTANADSKKAVEALRSVLDQDTAVLRIQKAWKKYRRRKTVAVFQALDISIDRLRNVEFAQASELLAAADTINVTKKVLSLLHLLEPSDEDTTPVRTFLSAFMILGHPTEVFNKNGQQEQDLIGKAKDLLISFESILSHLMSTQSVSCPPTQLETLSQAHATYITAFTAWKSKDASILIETMVDQFVAFDGIWQSVKDDTRGEAANDYRDGIRNQQVVLLSKIKRLAGPERANQLIKKAIRESRRQKNRRPPIGEVRPRPLTAWDQTALSSAAELPPSSGALDSSEEPATTATQKDFELTQVSKVFSVVPSNRVLVHELLIDPDYRIEVSPQSDVRSVLNREVCNSMRRGIEQGQSEIWTVAVAENIRKRLLKLLKPENSMHRLLSEVLDIEHVRNQCRQGVFSYDKFFGFMADLLPKLCAPVRDAEVQSVANALKTPTDDIDAMIEKLFRLLHVIDLMSLDYTNYMIQQAAPTLIEQGLGYEQRMFQADLDSNAVHLTKTKRWWRNASVNVLTEANNSDPAPSERPSFAKLYARGLVDLVFTEGTPIEHDVPETLQFDVERLNRLRTNMYRFLFVGGVLLTAKNLLKRDVRSLWKPEARRIFESVKDGYANDDGELSARVLAIVESFRGMPPSSRDHLYYTIFRFLTQFEAGRLSDPVLKLLQQRLKSHVFNRLAAQSSVERVRVASTTSEGLGAIGLGEFIAQIGTAAEELAKVSSVDLSAHRQWYEQVAEDLDGLANS